MNEIKELVLAPFLAEPKFVITWLFAPIVLIGIYEILCFFAKDEKKPFLSQINASKVSIRKPNLDLLSSITLILFLIFLGFYIYLMFFKEDFAYTDNFQFTYSNLIGKPYYMPIWRELGRFWPLGLLEYNFLALIGKNFLVYQAFSVLQALTVLLVINKIFSAFPLWYRLATMAVLITIPSFVISFFGLIYPERNVIFWLSLLILCCYSLVKTKNSNSSFRLFMYGAFICAQFCLYYKEPVFVLIGSFAGARLALNFLAERKQNGPKKGFLAFFKRNYIDFGLASLSILFFILYKGMVASHVVNGYKHNSQETLVATFYSYANENYLILTFIGIILLRIYLLFPRKYVDPLWDPLALGALLYFLVFVKLKMYTAYYLAPVEFLATLYLSYIAIHLVGRSKQVEKNKLLLSRTLLAFLTLLIISQNIQSSSYEILKRKSIVYGNIQLASNIKRYSKIGREETVISTLFFPSYTDDNFFNSCLIANFASFLDYKGIDLYDKLDFSSSGLEKQVESEELKPDISKSERTFVIKYPQKPQDSECLPFLPFYRSKALEPEPGDLIVVLPGFSDSVHKTLDSKDMQTVFLYQQQVNFSAIEKLLLKFSHRDFSYMDVYLLEKL